MKQIWLELYGNVPEAVQPALAFPRVLELVSQSLRTAGNIEESERAAQLASRTELLGEAQLAPQDAVATQREVGKMLNRLQAHNEGISALRRTQPFALEGESQGGVPFLIIEDARLFDRAGAPRKHVDREVWKHGPQTLDARRSSDHMERGEPLIIYMGDVGYGARDMLPLAYLVDSQKEPQGKPRIRWNSLKDLSASKVIHTSVQPFYLRRYARRVATLWEQEYGRRPVVRAVTAVSLNGRPYQELVDSEADLARVPVNWFRHNSWIRDLQTRRIPPDALAPGKVRLREPL